ncbi:hypothetical protein JJB99_29585 [Bradyrhizobium diazoefficiens]|uniref:hypothetical protein n=1 Tax=Bradyrhizobium diazoefficiens TaxID=1355477 RepID=UPI00190BAC85|nr:hypothetical protein [Bradyrhizobium diazoefficiens]QQO13515.1 hypothetical protein JJB99_29585 [Bradyrhizobium diazoefficiens]
MTFGKRQSGVGAATQALNADMTVARSQAVIGTAGATGSPIRWFLMLLACSALLYAHFVTYGPDLLRDHRLKGTWQPAYDLQATDGKCERTNFVITFCTVKIKSVARPDQAPIAHGFFMLFSSGGGEALVPVRSTADRDAVSIFYTAETKLWNRTLSFILGAVILALFDAGSLLLFWRSLN